MVSCFRLDVRSILNTASSRVQSGAMSSLLPGWQRALDPLRREHTIPLGASGLDGLWFPPDPGTRLAGAFYRVEPPFLGNALQHCGPAFAEA